MKKPILTKNEKGFTIIEVLIVLAIAGLIMVIVFLAVPALQRNSRNTQRTNDAAKVASAIGQCLTNKNGKPNECNDQAKITTSGGFEIGKLQQYEAANIQAPSTGNTSVTELKFGFGAKCDDANSLLAGGTAPSRAAVIRYTIENPGGDVQKCLDV